MCGMSASNANEWNETTVNQMREALKVGGQGEREREERR